MARPRARPLLRAATFVLHDQPQRSAHGAREEDVAAAIRGEAVDLFGAAGARLLEPLLRSTCVELDDERVGATRVGVAGKTPRRAARHVDRPVAVRGDGQALV